MHRDALRVAAILVAGGVGERFGGVGGKQLARVAGAPVVGHTARAFVASSVDRIVVVVHPDRVGEYESEVLAALEPVVVASPPPAPKPMLFVGGGPSRQESVLRGLEAVDDDVDVIVIHDGARPLVTAALIDDVVDALISDESVDGLVVGHPAYDTLKRVEGTDILDTPDRAGFWVAQTPQVFRAHAVRRSYREASEQGVSGTDDASLVEVAGGRVRMFEGPRINIKVTVAEDLDIVDSVLRHRKEGAS